MYAHIQCQLWVLKIIFNMLLDFAFKTSLFIDFAYILASWKHRYFLNNGKRYYNFFFYFFYNHIAYINKWGFYNIILVYLCTFNNGFLYFLSIFYHLNCFCNHCWWRWWRWHVDVYYGDFLLNIFFNINYIHCNFFFIIRFVL